MIRLCLMTCPSLEVARSVARDLLERRLVACVNLVPQITSLYWWEGAIQEDSEVLLVAKSHADRIAEITQLLPQIHPYQVPELVVLPIEKGLPAYLQWVAESVGLSQASEG